MARLVIRLQTYRVFLSLSFRTAHSNAHRVTAWRPTSGVTVTVTAATWATKWTAPHATRAGAIAPSTSSSVPHLTCAWSRQSCVTAQMIVGTIVTRPVTCAVRHFHLFSFKLILNLINKMTSGFYHIEFHYSMCFHCTPDKRNKKMKF